MVGAIDMPYWIPGETKREFRERLATEGRLTHYLERRKEMKEDGIHPSEIDVVLDMEFERRKSVRAPSDKQPGDKRVKDLKPLTEEDGLLSEKQMAHLQEKEPVSRFKEAEWVYQRIRAKKVDWKDAPSAGAWGWLMEIRADIDLRKDFYSKVWPGVIKSKNADTESEGYGRGEAEVSDILDRLESLKEDT